MELKEYQEKLNNLTEEEQVKRDLYLKRFGNASDVNDTEAIKLAQKNLEEIEIDGIHYKEGEMLQGPKTGLASIDKPWLPYYKDEYILPRLEGKTAYQMIYDSNKDHLDEKKLMYYGRKFSYKEMFDEIEKYKRAFVNLGVRKGDIVTFATVTTPELIFSMYALNRIGAISNLVDPRTQSKGLQAYLNETKSKYFFGLEMFNEETKKGIEGTNVEKVFIIDPTRYALPAPVRKLANIFKNKKNIYTDKIRSFDEFYKLTSITPKENVEDLPYEPNYPMAITHTGGTTGTPKGVLLTNDNFNGIAHQFENSPAQVTRDDTFLNVTVPFVAFGIINAMHYFLYKGANNIVIADFNPTMTKKLVDKYDPEIMLGAPSYFEGILESSKIKNMKYPIAGAEATKVEFENKMNEKFKSQNMDTKFMKGYGMTEVSACATVTVGDANTPGSVGIPLVNTNICVVDPDTGKELPIGEQGEICISGPGVMAGYYENIDETNKIKRVHEDGKEWIHSGDIGYIAKDGQVYITDRIKRIFTINGFKIYPSRLENLVVSLPGVDKCSVIGVEDGPNYKMVMYLVLDGSVDNNTVEQEIQYAIEKSDLASYYIPADIQYLDNLPINNAGKVDVIKLKEEYLKNNSKQIA